MADDLVERAQARVGRLLAGKYTLERLIGIGGMAAVYAARHRNGARSAVKILHPAIARDEGIRARFRNEGYAANKVGHPGAVRVLDDDVVADGDDAGTVYLVMELLEGESVHVRARRAGGILPESDVLAIAEGVLEVLEAAHARGIVHRDLKPDNLFLSDEEGRRRVKVLDFGIARIGDGAARTTAVGATLGTPSYMSPEQARGQRDLVDGRSDLFALGATMFRLLANRRIHEGEAAADVLGKVATIEAAPLRSVAPATSPSVAAIVDRALRFDREERYPHARAMLDDVLAARAGLSLPSGSAPRDAPIPVDTFLAGSEPTGVVRAGTVATVAAHGAANAAVPVDATVRDPVPPTIAASAVLPGPRPVPVELPATIDRGGAPPPELAATVAAPAAVATGAPPRAPGTSPPRARRAIAIVAGVAALALVIGIGIVATRARPETSGAPFVLDHEANAAAHGDDEPSEGEPEEPEAPSAQAPSEPSAAPAKTAPPKATAAPPPIAKPKPAPPKKPSKSKKGKGGG